MIQPLDAEAQVLVEFEAVVEIRGGLADPALEFRVTRELFLEPGEVRGPIAGRRVEDREVPGIGGGDFRADRDVGGPGGVVVFKEAGGRIHR